MTKVLIVDDDPAILTALSINLRARNYEVFTATNGSDALTAASKYRPDVVVLDLGLPDLDGTEVVGGLRGWSSARILVLSGRRDSSDKVNALDAGADDYLTKPFGMDELLARLRAMTRRATSPDDQRLLCFGDVTVDLVARRVTRLEEVVRLTPTEWQLLEALIRNPGKLQTNRQLLADAWGSGYETAQGSLRLYMRQLRMKLEPDPGRPRHFLNEPGMGYRFDP